ncbi:group-specific protein [Bacillus infantis]|uniref:group-specific protein n=1 Tax=Bacillus infantis TaxID=324767 RepID=UPI003CF8003D
MQGFIYHMVPNQMGGDKLVPLNSLKITHPDLYEKYTEKYLNHPERSKLLQRRIPKLNCLWNDVIHFLPLHPYFVFNALSNLGIKTKENITFYKIPIELLAHNKNAIYYYSKERYKGPSAGIVDEEMEFLNIQAYQELQEIPTDTLDYYKKENEKGNKFGLFHFIPHILSLGEVEVKDIEILAWNLLE